MRAKNEARQRLAIPACEAQRAAWAALWRLLLSPAPAVRVESHQGQEPERPEPKREDGDDRAA